MMLTLDGINFSLFYPVTKENDDMASYLLLRSNKESGPYTLQDLVNFGLKPYDLVWVEGKSAAWRYPGEVEELKPYAPGTEEQPYDRFFKKNTDESKPAPNSEVKKTIPEIIEEKVHPIPEPEQSFIDPQYEKYIPKKSVFVTLPGKKTVTVQKPAEQYVQPKPQQIQPEVKQVIEPVITVKENPAAQVKYSQPLEEIKEMYVKTLQDRKSKIARKSFLAANLKRASVILALVAIGALAGYVIKSNDSNRQSSMRNQALDQSSPALAASNAVLAPEEKANLAEVTGNDLPGSQTAANEMTMQDGAPKTNIEQRLAELERQHHLSLQEDAPRSQQRRQNIPVIQKESLFENTQAQPVETNPATGERSRTVRNENGNTETGKAIMKPSQPRKSGLESMVSVISNDYKRVAFGGIRNLELTIVNESKYALDKVTVELQYLKPSEEPLKTELVQFHSISPNGTMTMRIKDTNRGIKVAYKIIDIQSTQTGETAFKN